MKKKLYIMPSVRMVTLQPVTLLVGTIQTNTTTGYRFGVNYEEEGDEYEGDGEDEL